jgi:hypothetical protein
VLEPEDKHVVHLRETKENLDPPGDNHIAYEKLRLLGNVLGYLLKKIPLQKKRAWWQRKGEFENVHTTTLAGAGRSTYTGSLIKSSLESMSVPPTKTKMNVSNR